MPRKAKVIIKTQPIWSCKDNGPWVFSAPTPEWFTAGVWMRSREALQQAGFTLVPLSSGGDSSFNLQFTCDFLQGREAMKKRDEIFRLIMEF